MITAKEAKEITQRNSPVEKILEDISVAIQAEAEDGNYHVKYSFDTPNNLIEIIADQLRQNGYTVKVTHNELDISWRLA